jgi:erythromycin esterase
VSSWSYAARAAAQAPASRAASETEDTAAVVQWLGAHAIPLKSVQAGAGFDDLEPLESILKNVRVVGLGEATHGTREFFQFKHRMLEFLVKRMGFRVFAIEASYAACMAINDYVLYGKGDRAAALSGQGFWTWDTHEVADMIDWMREYNSHVPDSAKVQFLGFDIQNYDRAFDVITKYLEKVAPEYLPTAEQAFKPLRLADQRAVLAFGQRSAAEKAADMPRLWELFDFLEAHRERFVRRTSAAEFDEALQHARILLQFDDAYSSPLFNAPSLAESAGGKRDRYMAENIQHLMNAEPPGTRVVVWAHNGHVASGKGGPGMGAHLREAFGDEYYVLGFAFDSGSFQSRELVGGDLKKITSGQGIGSLREFTVGPAPRGSVDWYLEQARRGKPFSNYIVDFRSAPTEGPVAAWLSSSHPMYSMGSVFSTTWTPQQYLAPQVLRGAFDGLIFIEKTTRARPTPTGMRGPMASDTTKTAKTAKKS